LPYKCNLSLSSIFCTPASVFVFFTMFFPLLGLLAIIDLRRSRACLQTRFWSVYFLG